MRNLLNTHTKVVKMDANLEVLKRIFDIKRKEQEIKKADLELKSICKENCDLKAELSNTTSQIVEHKKTIESLEKENAKLALTKEIVTKEVEILENGLGEITVELNRKKNEHKSSFMAFQNGNVDFSKEALLFMNKDTSDLTNTVEELKATELAKKNSKANILRLEELNGKIKAMEFFIEIQEKKLKQIETMKNRDSLGN